MLRIFKNARIARPHKRVWKDVRRYMRRNPGQSTQRLWRMAVFRLKGLTDAAGYRFTIDDFASSTFDCVATISSYQRAYWIARLRSLVDEDKRDPDYLRYSLAGELVWSLISLVHLRLAGQQSISALLNLIEAGFRGAASDMRGQRKSDTSTRDI